MSLIPTPDQKVALDAILTWFGDGGKKLTLGGYAGTGKTTLLGQVKKRLPVGTHVVYASYTGKAVSVLRNKLPPGTEISTLHRLLYTPTHRITCKVSGLDLSLPANLGQARPGSAAQRTWCDKHMPKATAVRRGTDGELIDKPLPKSCVAVRKLDWLSNPMPLDGIDLVIVDEASMVSSKIWADLTKYDVPVLAVGDHAQLPPVKSDFNLMRDPEIKLETVVRQLESSPIIRLSMMVRNGERVSLGDYGDVVKIPHTRLGKVDLDPDSEEQMLIVGYNKTRNAINESLRRQCGRSGDPDKGDVVICLRNDYERGVFNGMRGRVQSFDLTNPSAPWAQIEIFGEDFTYEGLVSNDQFGQPKTGTEINRRLGLFDYGYALTAHKAQGSEADRVVVIEERMPGVSDEYHARWLYTSITRAVTSLVWVAE